ncbi:MAG: ADP-forming succinate--CoA ligase subunit beta [Hyphomicrobiaceae bacterium]
MFLHEFQAKELLARFGIPAPKGRVAASATDAERVARRLAFPRFAVKAQVHAGDRGANGGVVFAKDPAEVAAATARLIGRPLVTSQTAPTGQIVRLAYIEEAIDIDRLLYVAVTIDPSMGRLVLLASAAGGDDVEQVIARNPAAMLRLPISLANPPTSDAILAFATRLDLPPPLAAEVAGLMARLIDAAIDCDAQLIEINPLAVTPQGHLVALDAKMQVDENAMFRQPDLENLRDVEAAETGDPLELAAQIHQINYVRMDGNIGVVVNGAGLALATLDTLEDCGGRPANFMDIRTTATSQDIAYGFGLILSNPRTRVVLINVHGGGMQRCDMIAEGIAIAMRGAQRTLPLVVRLAGNNADFARTRLAASGLIVQEARDIRHAAELAVAAQQTDAA